MAVLEKNLSFKLLVSKCWFHPWSEDALWKCKLISTLLRLHYTYCLKCKIRLTLSKNKKSKWFVKWFMHFSLLALYGHWKGGQERWKGKSSQQSLFFLHLALSPIRFVGTFSKAGLLDSPAESHPGVFRFWLYTNWVPQFFISAY